MPFIRSISRWAATALVINLIIGSGIFGVPSELTRLLGRASPIAMVIAGLAQGVIMAPMIEVSSQFSEPGGPYLYVRTAFGRFAGLQAGWFSLLVPIGGAAANASLFIAYLGGLVPGLAHGWQRALMLALLIGIPAVANYTGVRSGARLSSLLTVAKLLPLGLLIVLGLARFGSHFEVIHASEIAAPGLGAWLSALLLMVFSYGGYEDALIPAGEVKDPGKTYGFALGAGLFVCVVIYALLQFVTVATIGTAPAERPVAQTAAVLLGPSGGLFVAVAVMISTYGTISAVILSAPRLACSLATHGEFPAFLGRLHRRFNTPAVAIALFAALVWLLAATGTFLWVLALTAGAGLIVYAGTCAALIRLRQLQPGAQALRVPFGPAFAILGIAISALIISQVELRQALLMALTVLIAAANWLWTKLSAKPPLDAELAQVGKEEKGSPASQAEGENVIRRPAL